MICNAAALGDAGKLKLSKVVMPRVQPNDEMK